VAGVQRSIFEIGHAPVQEIPEQKVEEYQDAPPIEPDIVLEEPIRLPVDMIGNREPDRGNSS